ncbi:hypothetical protein ACQUSR_15685 [Streptomyces sp. P1-3]|uniref:hypothetical protein n=1 Tax=Streptomyces sp. P1-3 TaxID=3421658 RepID=UPI003D366262
MQRRHLRVAAAVTIVLATALTGCKKDRDNNGGSGGLVSGGTSGGGSSSSAGTGGNVTMPPGADDINGLADASDVQCSYDAASKQLVYAATLTNPDMTKKFTYDAFVTWKSGGEHLRLQNSPKVATVDPQKSQPIKVTTGSAPVTAPVTCDVTIRKKPVG